MFNLKTRRFFSVAQGGFALKKHFILCLMVLLIVIVPTVGAFAEGALVDLGGTPPPVTDAPAVSEAPAVPEAPAASEAPAATASAAPVPTETVASAGFLSDISAWINYQYENNENFTLYVALLLAGIALIIFLFVFIGYKVRVKRMARKQGSGASDEPERQERVYDENSANDGRSAGKRAEQHTIEPVIEENLDEAPSVSDTKSAEESAHTVKVDNISDQAPGTSATEADNSTDAEREEERLRGLEELSAAAAAFSAAVETAGAAAMQNEPIAEPIVANLEETPQAPAPEATAVTEADITHHAHKHLSRRSHTRSEMHSGHHKSKAEHPAEDVKSDPMPKPAASEASAEKPDIEYNPEIVANLTTDETDYSSAASVAAAISSIMSEARQEAPTPAKVHIEDDIHVIDENSEKPYVGMHDTPYDADISRYTMQPGIDVNDVSRNTKAGFAGGMKRIELGMEERIPSRLDETDHRQAGKSVGSRASRKGRRRK